MKMGGSEIILHIDELIGYATHPSQKVLHEVRMKDDFLIVDLEGKDLKVGLALNESEAQEIYAVLYEYFKNHSEFLICSVCYGFGKTDNEKGYRVVPCEYCRSIGRIHRTEKCYNCDGLGEVDNDITGEVSVKCAICDGTGRVPKRKVES